MHITPLVKRLKEAFLIDDFIDAGYSIEYWDLSKIYKPKVTLPDIIEESYIYRFNQLSEVRNSLSNLDVKQSVFIIQFDKCYSCSDLFILLSRFNCTTIRINIYPRTIQKVPINMQTWRFLIFSVSFYKLLLKYFRTILFSIFETNKKIFDYYFACNSSATHRINAPDYDNYQKIRRNKPRRLIEEDYILFIDIYFPLHGETTERYSNRNEISKKYQKHMSRFFNWMEKNYKKPVVIAAHPSSDYRNKEFGNRKIIKNKTALLVRDASLVITHASTSHIYAVLFNKPIVFIKTKEMSFKINILARHFNKKAYDIYSVNYSHMDFSPINEELRVNYIYSELTSHSTKHKNNSEIILKQVDSIFEKLK